jgi:type I restriction enzyme S subunit
MKHNNIKSNFISENIRFNAGYYLNDDALNSYKIESNSKKCKPLFEIANVFNPPIFKRQFCQSTDRAVQYCQSSDVTNALEGSEVFINKLQAEKVESIVKKDQILITGFGTIGNTRLVNELSNGISYANNVCRVEAHNNIPYGYIYAFLTSKYGRAQVNKNASGSVVRYIEAPGIKRTLIPLLEESIQQQIHQLIIEASALRVEASKLFKEAIDLFEQEINEGNIKLGFQYDRISSKDIFSKHKRFDSQYQVIWKNIKKKYKTIKYQRIGELAINIFVGGRGKRNYVDNGVPFLSSSDMMLFNPVRNSKKVSFNTLGLKSMRVEKFDILISRSGTVGNTVIVGDSMKNVAVSEHALRLKINPDLISPSYVFAFLNTNIGKRAMEASAFGSVIITLNEELIGDIDIPILDKSIQNSISTKVEKYMESIDNATSKENQAIDLIEKEIDAWQ